VNERLDEWSTELEGKGLMISKSKTETTIYNFVENYRKIDRARRVIKIEGEM